MTSAIAHKILQIIQGMLEAGCRQGSLSSLQHFIFSELELDEEDGGMTQRVYPALDGSNEILSLAKLNLFYALSQPDDSDSSHSKASPTSIKVRLWGQLQRVWLTGAQLKAGFLQEKPETRWLWMSIRAGDGNTIHSLFLLLPCPLQYFPSTTVCWTPFRPSPLSFSTLINTVKTLIRIFGALRQISNLSTFHFAYPFSSFAF
jgi:hypothetical protein